MGSGQRFRFGMVRCAYTCTDTCSREISTEVRKRISTSQQRYIMQISNSAKSKPVMHISKLLLKYSFESLPISLGASYKKVIKATVIYILFTGWMAYVSLKTKEKYKESIITAQLYLIRKESSGTKIL